MNIFSKQEDDLEYPPFCKGDKQDGRHVVNHKMDAVKYETVDVFQAWEEPKKPPLDNKKMKDVKKDDWMSKMKKWLTCKVFEEFCNETSIHGFNHIVAPKRHLLEKIGWLVATLLAGLGALQVCLEQWRRYVASPSVVALEKDYRNWNNSFLALTACQDLRYTREPEALIERTWGVKPGEEKFEYYMQFLKVLTNATLSNLTVFEVYANDETLKDVDLFKIVTEAIIPFQGLVAWFDKTINVSFVNVMTERGICHTINSVVSRDQAISLPQTRNFPPSSEVVSCQFITHPCYFRIELYQICSTYYAHSPYELTDLSTEMVAHLCPGLDTSTDWKVTETKALQDVRDLSVEQRKCRYYDEPENDKHDVYSNSICRRKCRNEIALKQCGCKPYFYFQEEGKPCDPAGMACLAKQAKLLLKIPGCKCQGQCEDASFVLSNRKESHWSGPFAARSSKKVAILSPRSRYRRQILFCFEDLVVSFGGAAGLFLGCSFLSGIEIVYFVLERTWLFLFNLIKRKPNQAVTTLTDKDKMGDSDVFITYNHRQNVGHSTENSEITLDPRKEFMRKYVDKAVALEKASYGNFKFDYKE